MNKLYLLIMLLSFAVLSSNQIMVEISYGELIDKITILQIKLERIKDQAKRANVQKELTILEKTIANYRLSSELTTIITNLKKVNEKLWDIEDAIRDKERKKEFDEEFIHLARSVYVTNDLRFALKSEINKLFGSAIIEEKSYADYSADAILAPQLNNTQKKLLDGRIVRA